MSTPTSSALASETAEAGASVADHTTAAAPRRRAVAAWIFACAAMVLAMVVVGGVTRLTRSGLSIVDWKPITGVLPPMSPEAWQAEFARYQTSPEFRLVNSHMGLDGFRSIYLVEWFHRLLGRLVGVVTFVPLVYFAAKRALSKRRVRQVLTLFVMGGAQGALGWFMVKSGLADIPRVSPYRLTAHLLLALVIFAGLLSSALDEARGDRASRGTVASFAVTVLGRALLPLVLLTLSWGGFMAGLHAGLIAPSFPTMNGKWIPDGMGALAPAWRNVVENPIAVHFVHRLLAYLTALVALAASASILARPSSRALRVCAVGLGVTVLLQITLGALTVLGHVPITLAALHQTNGAVLLGWVVALLHCMRPARDAQPE